MKGSKKKPSDSAKRYYAGYDPVKQREMRLKRHMKKHPNDGQAEKAKPVFRRRKPLTKGGWLNRQMAKEIYIGNYGKDDDAISILNSMTNFDQKLMARLSAKVKSVRNRAEYQKETKTKPKLGYAG
jgi:hypothetical protein